MTQPPDQESTTADRSGAKPRLLAAGIMFIPVAVVLLSSVLWWLVQRGHIDLLGMLGTHNHGQLLHPVQGARDMGFVDDNRQDYDDLVAEGKWSLLIPGASTCDDACRETLWLTRQLHTALGRRALYLRRYYVTDTLPLDSELQDYLSREHPRLTVLQATGRRLGELVDAVEGDDSPVFFLADKQGYLMMYYTAQNSGRDVIADLKFLMKQTGDD